jgi:hypothetical protein
MKEKTVKLGNQKVSQADLKFFVEKGDPGFSPEHNKRVIDKTIKNYELMRHNKLKAWKDKVGERSDVVATYLHSRAAQSDVPIDKYISKKYMAYLQGKRIMQVIHDGMAQLVEVSRNDA